MVMFEAERFASTVAPASAASVDGGSGDQRSSQISTWRQKPGRSGVSNSRSVPNGASWPSRVTVSETASKPEVNWRFS